MDRKHRVLIADDSRFFRSIERQFLQKTPVEIFEADSCDAARLIIREEKPDLVYMAFSLPDRGGADCCHAIKSDPMTRSLPVVIVCDQDARDQPEISRKKGCDAILVKPLDKHSFLEAGRRFLEGIREHRQSSFFRITFTANDQEYNGQCLDISSGGMFIDSQAEVTVGSLVNVSFKLPNQFKTQVFCKAIVAWINRKPNPLKPHYPLGLGLKFLDLSSAQRMAILQTFNKKAADE